MLEKAIKFGKEKRKPYYGAKLYHRSSRNNGSDSWAVQNRTFFDKKARLIANLQIQDYFEHTA